jgi:hypothetical protein
MVMTDGPLPVATPIKIINALPVPPDVSIPNDGAVEFTNTDMEIRYIQLFDHTNTGNPVLFVKLAPLQTVTFVNGWSQNEHDKICPYNVRVFGHSSRTKDTGGNKIIIGSTPDQKRKSKKRKKN